MSQPLTETERCARIADAEPIFPNLDRATAMEMWEKCLDAGRNNRDQVDALIFLIRQITELTRDEIARRIRETDRDVSSVEPESSDHSLNLLSLPLPLRNDWLHDHVEFLTGRLKSMTPDEFSELRRLANKDDDENNS